MGWNVVKQFWDWVDERDIDKHVVTTVVLWNTISITKWGMSFASANPTLDGATILAAVIAPFSLLQAAAIKWFYDART